LAVLLQANYRRQANPTISVPAPNDGNGDPFWYDHLALNIHSYAQSGFKYLQLPPQMMTIGGDSPTSDGYGVFWEYHYGTEQHPTRFGYDQILRRMCAMGWANGIYPLADWVPHQRYGGKRIDGQTVYEYDSWGGKGQGRFRKDGRDFRHVSGTDGNLAPQDDVFDKFWDFAFGDELSPQQDLNKNYLRTGLKLAGDWMYRALDLKGCRDDDIKGQVREIVAEWCKYRSMNGQFVIGEFAEGNKDTLAWVLSQLPDNFQLFDFEVKYRIRDMCNNGSRYDMRRLKNAGLMSKGGYWAMRAVNFLENADSDTNGFGAVVFNKLLGYAWILTSEGLPCVYYRDYAQEKYCYGLKPKIDNLIWIHEKCAHGETTWRHAEYQFVVYERTGAPGLLVGLNNDIWGGWKSIYVQTNFGANVRLHDYSGHADDIWTDGNGGCSIWIPPNNNGTGYVCYSRPGLDGPLPVASHPTTQMFEGSPDLLTGPALNDGNLTAKIFCEKDTPITISKESGNGVRFEVTDPLNQPVLKRDEWHGRTAYRGYHTITAFSSGANPTPYVMDVTYKAPQSLTKNEL